MPESGFVEIAGVRAELTYLKGLFDKLGVEADFLQVGDFKGASEPYTREGMSPEFRKQFEGVIDDFYSDMVSSIAHDRKLDESKVKELIDQGLFVASDAKAAGLIDRVAYEDQLETALKEQLKSDELDYDKNYGKEAIDTDFSGITGLMKLINMMMGIEPATTATSGKKIAVVYAVGPIMTGNSSTSFFGESTVGSDTIVKALREAAEDKTVAAIVLRVDSPGGSAVASDLIWRQIQQIEKPVYASMGDIAASGGYYISMGCDKIYAEPGTLTGSIGVVSGKLATKKAFGKIGVNTEVIARGKNSGLFSMEEKFTDSERDAMMKLMNDVYGQFTAKAAAGRKMEVDKLQSLAQGKLWSGRQAKENGLVDEVGTLRDALKAAKLAAGLKEDDKAEVLTLPKPRSIFDELLDPEGADARIGSRLVGEEALRAVDGLSPAAGVQLREAALWQELFRERAVLMMPYRVQIK
jgi:protease-4